MRPKTMRGRRKTAYPRRGKIRGAGAKRAAIRLHRQHEFQLALYRDTPPRPLTRQVERARARDRAIKKDASSAAKKQARRVKQKARAR